MNAWKNRKGTRGAKALSLALGFVLLNSANAAPTELADSPVAASTMPPSTIMFTADDSGSMKRTYTPENLPEISGGCPRSPSDKYGMCTIDEGAIDTRIAFKPADIFQKGQPPMMAAAFNGLAYNPLVRYDPPKRGDGTSFPNATYSNAGWPSSEWTFNNGAPENFNLTTVTHSYSVSEFDNLKSTYNINKSNVNVGDYKVGDSYRLPPHYFITTVTWCVNPSSSNCVATFDLSHRYPRYGAFELVVLDYKNNRGATHEFTNYANWVAYYRNRAAASRTVVSLAFSEAVCLSGTAECEEAGIPRVGYSTINVLVGGQYALGKAATINPNTFSGAHRNNLLQTMLRGRVEGGTPLTGAAKTVGKLFRDNSQYILNRCQRNYHILFTDGLWNFYSGDSVIGDVDGSSVPTLPKSSLGESVTQVYGRDLITGRPWPAPIRDVNRQSSTLSDIALYYWMTDLKTGKGWDNDVRATADDPATWQHLNFVGMGFGVQGRLSAADVEQIKQGNPSSSWPKIKLEDTTGGAGNVIETVDDLWHASFNGFGKYVSESSPAAFGEGLYSILKGILEIGSARTGVAMTSPDLTTGEELTYTASFRGSTGDIAKKKIDELGVEGSTEKNAKDGFDAKNYFDKDKATETSKADRRQVFTANGSSAVLFDRKHWTSLSLDQRAALGNSQDLMDYLRGDWKPEWADIYRSRENVLGDIVNSKPVVVAKPPCVEGEKDAVTCTYDEENNQKYADFYTDIRKRKTMLYVGANDGMLHAFDGDLNEVWAYIPSALFRSEKEGGIANLARKKDFKHYFYVDATPKAVDVQFADETWHTVLVGGLAKGGKMYYALDVTDGAVGDPTSKFLWEFKADISQDLYLGYTFGRPIITKTNAIETSWRRSDGGKEKWMAILPSGYNNEGGRGHLYFLDVQTGQKLLTLNLPQSDNGTTDSPTNLAYIAGYVKDSKDQLTTAVYGADEKGNFWRFNLESLNQDDWSAKAIGVLKDKNARPQYVTTEPTLTVTDPNSDNNRRWALMGTGGFRNKNDLTEDTTENSFYVFRDGSKEKARDATEDPYGRSKMQEILFDEIEPKDKTDVPTNWGWYMDLGKDRHNYHVTVNPIALSEKVIFAVNAYQLSNTDKDYLSGEVCDTAIFRGRLYIRNISTGNSLLKDDDGKIIPYLDEPRGIASIDVVKVKDKDGNEQLRVLMKPFDQPAKLVGDNLMGGTSSGVPERVNIRYITKQ